MGTKLIENTRVELYLISQLKAISKMCKEVNTSSSEQMRKVIQRTAENADLAISETEK